MPVTSTSRSHLGYITETRFEFTEIDAHTVLELLLAMPVNKATGLDEIRCKLLKCTAPQIVASLTIIFNTSVNTNSFPDDWKVARVKPIYKGDSKVDANNYRPISVLIVISKTFERVLYDQLYNYLDYNNLLSEHQSGFRSHHSTTTALLDATSACLKSIDRDELNIVVFLDLTKAFDTVNHDKLIEKLSAYGIQSRSLSWFQSYLQSYSQTKMLCKWDTCQVKEQLLVVFLRVL